MYWEELTAVTVISRLPSWGSSPSKAGSGVTDQNGRLVVPGLTKGVAYTVEETVPEGYVCDNPGQTVIIRAGTNTVTFENRPVYGSIEISKVDPEGNPLAGVSFLLEYSRDGKNWKSVTFREEGSLPEVGSCTSSGLKDGILTTAEDGIAMFSGLSISIEIIVGKRPFKGGFGE